MRDFKMHDQDRPPIAPVGAIQPKPTRYAPGFGKRGCGADKLHPVRIAREQKANMI